jgi:NitT/TauT family transport system substrate-binding protein
MVGGSVDLVSGSFEHTINMQAKGISIVAVALQGRYPAIVLGMKKDKAAAYKSGKDLKGLKIGVTAPGSSTNMFVSNLLAKDGLPPDAVSIVGVGAGAGAVAAMKKGEIDGIANLDPVIHRLEAAGDIVTVVDTRTANGSQAVYGGVYPAGSVYLPTEFTKKNPNTTQAVVNAMVRAVLWIQKATPEQIVATVPPEYYGDDKAVYKAALEKNLATFSPDGTIPVDGVKNVYAVLNAFEPSVKEAKIDLAKTFDNSFVQKALAKYRGK